jgi:hypothetical protein
MEFKFHFSAAVICGAALALALAPSYPTALAFAVACALFGFLHFIERERTQQIVELEKKILALKDRIDGLALTRGIGR